MNNKRAMYILLVFCIMFMTLIGYITYIEIRYGDEYIHSAYNARNSVKDKSVIRGSIYDRNNIKLAYSEENDGKLTRKYPYDNMYSHVIGYVSEDYSNRTLIEKEFNSHLIGESGINKLTNLGNKLTSKKAKGNDVYLTIDHEIQKAAYNALGGFNGAIVALKVKTGEILAMVSKPDFNPNPEVFSKNYNNLSDSTLYTRAIQVLYPPGSTFKTITTASIIENGLEDEIYEDSSGEFVIKSADGNPDNDYKCANEDARHAYGTTDLQKAFTVSSNVYYAYMGTRLSSAKIQKTARSFLFNKEIPFDLPVVKSHFQKGKLTEAERAISVIGQGQTEASPLHLALIAATIANEGKMPKPYIVSSVKSGVVSAYTANKSSLGQIIPKKDAGIIKDFMLEVVKTGTGKAAAINGIEVCGKTGTSENPLTATGGHNSKKTHALFIGFAPYDEPEIAVSVVMEYAGFGGTNAAPAAKTIMQKYFEIYNKE
ncbi:MAG: peptidoglycan glycosyltransferase [Clostridia bacterium]|nr:peptidoglycan glycosyltransferase [Clostridia bacterium]